MKTETIYEARLKTADIATAAKSAMAVHPEITLGLGEHGLSFWCKDDRKECAVVGTLNLPDGAAGEIIIRAKAKQLADLVATFDAKIPILLMVQQDADGLVLRLDQDSTMRVASVQEAEKDDLPFEPEYKSAASCIVDLMAFAKVVASFKREADVMNIRIKEGFGFEASYKTRDGVDSWHFPNEDAKGDHSVRFNVALLLAAVKAAKAVDTMAKVQISKGGPLRIIVGAKGDAMRCMTYVVSSQSM